jgi:hypothetical protein
MSLKWISIRDRKPANEQVCLTKMKHGIIEGVYDAEEENFTGYYWTDIIWNAYAWVPIEDAG